MLNPQDLMFIPPQEVVPTFLTPPPPPPPEPAKPVVYDFVVLKVMPTVSAYDVGENADKQLRDLASSGCYRCGGRGISQFRVRGAHAVVCKCVQETAAVRAELLAQAKAVTEAVSG